MYISILGTLPSAQGKGVGRALIEVLEAESKMLGADMTLLCPAPSVVRFRIIFGSPKSTLWQELN